MPISCCCSPHARNLRSSSIWQWKAASMRARPSLNSSGQKGTRGMAGQPCALPCAICVICSLRAPMFLLYLTSALDLDLYILLEACTLARASTHTSLTMPEEAQHIMAEPMQLLGLLTILPAPEIEHLYTHLGRAYELNEEWKKARAVYTMMLAHARDACQPAMESAAQSRLEALAAQSFFYLAIAQ